MRARILIVGQGLAGTLLAWAFERAGIAFEIIDRGHDEAASRVAAGIINPITGQRFVKSWRVEELLPFARETYRAIEDSLGIRIWRPLRVRRIFASAAERQLFAEKRAKGTLEPFASDSDEEGFWIEGAARVDLPALLPVSRARWLAKHLLQEASVDLEHVAPEYDLVVDCRGVHATSDDDAQHALAGVAGRCMPWRFSKGESLNVAIDGLQPDVVLNRGHWVLPMEPGFAKIGATHTPGCRDTVLTAESLGLLRASLTAITHRAFTVMNQEAGVRVYVDDKRPVVGRDPRNPRRGFLNALGAKGALYGPAMARQWVNHLTDGIPFNAEIDVRRCLSSSV